MPYEPQHLDLLRLTPACRCPAASPTSNKDVYVFYLRPTHSQNEALCRECGAVWRTSRHVGSQRVATRREFTEIIVKNALERGVLTPEQTDAALRDLCGVTLGGTFVDWQCETRYDEHFSFRVYRIDHPQAGRVEVHAPPEEVGGFWKAVIGGESHALHSRHANPAKSEAYQYATSLAAQQAPPQGKVTGG